MVFPGWCFRVRTEKEQQPSRAQSWGQQEGERNGLCCTGRARKETPQRWRNTFSRRNCWKKTAAEGLFTCIRRWLWSSVDASLASVQQNLSVLLPGKELECVTLCWVCFLFFPYLFLVCWPRIVLAKQAENQSSGYVLGQSCPDPFTWSSSPTSHLLHNMRAMCRLLAVLCCLPLPSHPHQEVVGKLWCTPQVLKEFSCGSSCKCPTEIFLQMENSFEINRKISQDENFLLKLLECLHLFQTCWTVEDPLTAVGSGKYLLDCLPKTPLFPSSHGPHSILKMLVGVRDLECVWNWWDKEKQL